MNILIIEDNQELAKEYIRIFNHILEGDFVYTHLSDIASAIPAITDENWEMIIVDSDLGDPAMYPEGAAEGEGEEIRNGRDLVLLRLRTQKNKPLIKKSYILGIASSNVALNQFRSTGADDWFIKLDIPEMAHRISDLYNPKEKEA